MVIIARHAIVNIQNRKENLLLEINFIINNMAIALDVSAIDDT